MTICDPDDRSRSHSLTSISAGCLSRHGASVLPSHRRAIADILACRTRAHGGYLWRCNHCSSEVYPYHSCKNRSCPRWHKDQTERWIAARKVELLACPLLLHFSCRRSCARCCAPTSATAMPRS